MILCLGTTPTLARTMEFEKLAVGDVNRAAAVYEYAAGKAVNAARAARVLGEAILCMGFHGGATGERLLSLLQEAALRQAFIQVSAPTRLCVTAIDRAGGTTTELVEESSAVNPQDGERLLARLKAQLQTARVAVMSGSLASGLNPDFYARCIAAARAAGVPTVLDASGAPLREAVAAKPAIIKVNEAELATISGGGTVIANASALAQQTRGWVVVTRGSAPTIAVHASSPPLDVRVPAVKVVSAVGSGDSFAGALAVGMLRGMPMADALRLATACASANATTPHAAHFARSDAEALVPQTVVSAPAPA